MHLGLQNGTNHHVELLPSAWHKNLSQRGTAFPLDRWYLGWGQIGKITDTVGRGELISALMKTIPNAPGNGKHDLCYPILQQNLRITGDKKMGEKRKLKQVKYLCVFSLLPLPSFFHCSWQCNLEPVSRSLNMFNRTRWCVQWALAGPMLKALVIWMKNRSLCSKTEWVKYRRLCTLYFYNLQVKNSNMGKFLGHSQQGRSQEKREN